MRVEGDLWVAYYALPKTMDGALFLGSIRMAFVQDFAAKRIFMALMRDAVSAILKDATGVQPDWPGKVIEVMKCSKCGWSVTK